MSNRATVLKRSIEKSATELAKLQAACQHRWKLVQQPSGTGQNNLDLLFIENHAFKCREVQYPVLEVKCAECQVKSALSSKLHCPHCLELMKPIRIGYLNPEEGRYRNSPRYPAEPFGLCEARQCRGCHFVLVQGDTYRDNY